MSLQTLLGGISSQHFVAEYLHRLPISMPGTAAELCQLGNWEILGRILEAGYSPDLMVVQSGRHSDVSIPANLEEAQRLCEAGHTILVRHAERHDPQLQQLANSFEQDLHAPANIHMYVTPSGNHGFSWHYDAEDVFIIQTAGAKRYSLRKNTVNPWPLVETIPQNMRYERELMPLMEVELRAGDWLYIPCGYWHKAEACDTGTPAMSLALGVMSRAAIDVFDFLRTRLLDSLLWRQRLPITGTAASLSPEELESHYAELFSQLAEDLSQTMQSAEFSRMYREWASRVAE